MKRFKKVYIEITNICNLSCNFCPKTKRPSRFMHPEEFIHILDEVEPYTDHIYFHLMGEPLLNPELDRFLELSYNKGLFVNLTTNGALIRQKMDVLLGSKALRQLNISLSSYEANDSLMTLKEYMDDIIEFLNEADSRGNLICSLRLWNLDSEVLKGENLLNNEILDRLQQGLDLDFDIKDKLDNSNGIKLKNKIYLNAAEKFEWPDIDNKKSEDEVFCYGLRDQIGILADGTVVPCCLDNDGNIPLGNIFKTSLFDILQTEKAQRIYQGFSNRNAVEELCRSCGYAKRF